MFLPLAASNGFNERYTTTIVMTDCTSRDRQSRNGSLLRLSRERHNLPNPNNDQLAETAASTRGVPERARI